MYNLCFSSARIYYIILYGYSMVGLFEPFSTVAIKRDNRRAGFHFLLYDLNSIITADRNN